MIEIPAQEILDWDIDSLFNEPYVKIESTDESYISEITVLDMMNRRSLTFDASFGFSAGVSPGWIEPPWFESEENHFSWNPGAVLRSSLNLDAKISKAFRVMCGFNFIIPDTRGFYLNLGTLFFDYNLIDTVFFRGGKYYLKWGISPNFGFTNLLSRVPDNEGFSNDSFILKADIPVGIGGFQFLVLTRADFAGGVYPNRENVGFGGKYNLALRKFDADAGVFYHYGMPVRSFISLKTTFGNTEIYSEGLAAFDTSETLNISGAYNFGFAHEFFNNKLAVNGEFFFNNEGNSFFYTSKTDYQDAKTTPFIEGINIAFNLLYRFGGKGNPRFYLQTLYSVQDKSARVVPAFRLGPLPHVELYLAFPMDLGDTDGYYYKNNWIKNRDGMPLRFAAVFLVSLSGNFKFTAYSQD
jgi:hypothetical protein